jgi:hypothetical protein
MRDARAFREHVFFQQQTARAAGDRQQAKQQPQHPMGAHNSNPSSLSSKLLAWEGAQAHQAVVLADHYLVEQAQQRAEEVPAQVGDRKLIHSFN